MLPFSLESIPNESKILDPPRLGVAKSNSEHSLNNVNLADSILPDIQNSKSEEIKEEQQE